MKTAVERIEIKRQEPTFRAIATSSGTTGASVPRKRPPRLRRLVHIWSVARARLTGYDEV